MNLLGAPVTASEVVLVKFIKTKTLPVLELTKQLNYKSIEIKCNIYIKVDP